MAFADDYNTVPERMAEFFEAYPTGCLRAAEPFRIVEVDGVTFLAYTAAAYRTPDDPAPGIGSAWERVPGQTNFTRNSELQNAETSAWGRAIVAVGAADTKKGIASFEDVRNRRDEPDPGSLPMHPNKVRSLREKCEQLGISASEIARSATQGRTADPEHLLVSDTDAVKEALDRATPADGGGAVPTPSPSADDTAAVS